MGGCWGGFSLFGFEQLGLIYSICGGIWGLLLREDVYIASWITWSSACVRERCHDSSKGWGWVDFEVKIGIVNKLCRGSFMGVYSRQAGTRNSNYVPQQKTGAAL